jgi:3-hydroxyisobutyrate dehydrogenase
MKTGFIGLGTLGSTLARRLMAEGLELVVWNRTRSKAEALAKEGAELADSPADAISKVNLLILNLFDSDAVDSVISGPGGIMEGDYKGKVIVDTTTNHFESVEYFHTILEEHGASYLESPVLGSVVPAAQGALTVLVSGDETSYNEARPALEKIGKNIFFLPQRGTATRMKLVNNLVLGNFMTVLVEALGLAEASGLSRQEALDILGAGAGNSLVLNAKRQKLLDEDFSVQFSSAAIYKDLHYVQDLARSLRMPLLTAPGAKELFAMTFAQGIADDDFAGVFRVVKGFSRNI